MHPYIHTKEGIRWCSVYSINPEGDNFDKLKPISNSSQVFRRYKILRNLVKESLKINSLALEALAEIKPGERTNFVFIGFGKEEPIILTSYRDENGGYNLNIGGVRSTYAKTRKDIIPELVDLIL